MAEYNYHCNNCDKDITVELRITEAPLKVCPECNGENCLDRIWEKGISYINKSGGFYNNSNL